MKISVVRSETTTSSWSLSRSQWGEARLHPHANSLHHLLQHDASMSHRRSQQRWHLHMIPHWWQPIQLAAPTGPHQDPSRVSRMGATFCRWCHLCSPYTKSPAAHNVLLRIGIPNSLVLKSAWRSQRFFISPPPRKRSAHLTLQLTRQNWRQSSSSPTWGAPSLTKANSAFGRLYSCVSSSKHLKKATKSNIYRAVVLPTLLYGSETWVTYSNHLWLLERFHQRCFRCILNIHWSDYVTNVEVLQQAGITSIEAMLLKTQLRWAGHISRMEVHHLPKISLYGELSTGHRDRGAPKKWFKDLLKKSLSAYHIYHCQWSALAADQEACRHTVHQSVSSFENNHNAALEEKCSKRKNRIISAPTPDSSYPCSRCGRVCL